VANHPLPTEGICSTEPTSRKAGELAVFGCGSARIHSLDLSDTSSSRFVIQRTNCLPTITVLWAS
jgi:hypothetical protein